MITIFTDLISRICVAHLWIEIPFVLPCETEVPCSFFSSLTEKKEQGTSVSQGTFVPAIPTIYNDIKNLKNQKRFLYNFKIIHRMD